MRVALWVLSALLFIAAAPVLGQGTWHVDTLDIAVDGNAFSMVLDEYGEGILSGRGFGNYLYFRHWTENGWEVAADSLGFLSTVGYSMALDVEGLIHSVWSTHLGSQIEYGFWNGTSWEREVFAGFSGTCFNPSLALTPEGEPRIAFYQAASGAIRCFYAEKNGSTWTFDTLSVSSNPGNWQKFTCPLVLDASGAPHIAFWDDWALVYGSRPSSTWQFTTVDTGDQTGCRASLALTSSGLPRIAFRTHEGVRELRYASWNGAEWTVDFLASIDNPLSLALDSQDQPRIVHDTPANAPIYLAWNGSAWESTLLDSLFANCGFIPLALDAFDRPYFAAVGNSTCYFAWLNAPPDPFDLLGPVDGDYVTSTPTLTWEAADLRVTYDVWYAVDPGFNPHWEFTDIDETEFQFPSGYLSPGGTYHWKVLARDDYDGYETWSTAPGGGGGETYWTMHISPTGTEGQVEAALGTPSLFASPNPSQGDAALFFEVPWSGPVVLTVYDISGREVQRFEESALTAGQHMRTMEDLPSGAYHCRLEACGSVAALRFVVLR